MNNNLTLHNPYNPYQPLVDKKHDYNSNAQPKYPSIPIPPTADHHAPRFHGQMPHYPHLNPIPPFNNNPNQPIYPSFPIPPTGPRNNFIPHYQHNLPHPVHLIADREESKSNSVVQQPQHNPRPTRGIESLDKKLNSGRFTCYSVFLYVMLVLTIKCLILEVLILTRHPPMFKFLACFFLTFWMLIQCILAVKAMSKKSLDHAKKAVWFMKGYIGFLLCFIIYFIARRAGVSHHRHRYGGHHHGHGHGHGHGYGHRSWEGHGGKYEALFFNLCIVGSIIGLLIHIFVTLKGARKVRDLLAKREAIMRTNGEEENMRVNA